MAQKHKTVKCNKRYWRDDANVWLLNSESPLRFLGGSNCEGAPAGAYGPDAACGEPSATAAMTLKGIHPQHQRLGFRNKHP